MSYKNPDTSSAMETLHIAMKEASANFANAITQDSIMINEHIVMDTLHKPAVMCLSCEQSYEYSNENELMN